LCDWALSSPGVSRIACVGPGQRGWRIALIVCAVAVVVVAAYLVQHHDSVHDAGQIPSVANLSTASTTAPALSPPSSPLTPAPSASTITVTPEITAAFIGDDWTAGVGASSPTDRFSTRVCAALHLREVNLGVNEAGYAKSPGHTAYESQVAAALGAHPRLVVVSGGRNDNWDSPATDAAAATALFRALRARLRHAVIAAVAPMWGDSPTTAAMTELGRSVRRAVTAVHGTYLAIPDPIRGHPNEMADAADPNDAGYAAIAAELTPVLRPLLR
jgi:lysophospholipase L1-like esterase